MSKDKISFATAGSLSLAAAKPLTTLLFVIWLLLTIFLILFLLLRRIIVKLMRSLECTVTNHISIIWFKLNYIKYDPSNKPLLASH